MSDGVWQTHRTLGGKRIKKRDLNAIDREQWEGKR